ncbi:MAG: ABC transporter substrate-binding protein [Thermostichus sp. DG_1_6_bins_120]
MRAFSLKLTVLLGTALGSLVFAPAFAQTTTITFYYPVGVAGPLARFIETYVEEFEAQHPDINVETVFGGNYVENQSKIVAAQRAGTPPDVAILLSQELRTLISLDVVESMQPLIDADPEGEAMIADFFPAFLLNSTLDGEVWSIPFQRSTPVLYYNKEAFVEAGLDPDSPPTTWEELIKYAKKLTQRDAQGRVTRYGIAIPTGDRSTWLTEALVMQAGGSLYDPNSDGKVVTIDTPAMRAAMQYVYDLQHTHEVSPKGVIAWGTVPNDFAAGNVAMIYHSTGSLGFIRQNADFEFGTAFLPANKQYGVPTGGGNFYLLKGSDPAKREAVWTFTKWMTSPELLARWSIDSGYVAPRISSWELPTMKEYVAQYPQALTAREQLQYAQAELPVYALQEIKDIVSKAEQDIILGNAKIEEALAEAQRRADQVLAAFR